MLRLGLKRWGPVYLHPRGGRSFSLSLLRFPAPSRWATSRNGSVTCELQPTFGTRSSHTGIPKAGQVDFRTPDNDTIYALSSAHGRAGVAVIRISGPDCLKVRPSLGWFHSPPSHGRTSSFRLM